MNKLRKEFDGFIADHEGGHSDLQMDYFITRRNGVTDYGMYRQALRELVKRYRGLKGLRIDREEKLLEIERAEFEGSLVEDWYKTRRAGIDEARARMQLEDIDMAIKETEREFERFFLQCRELRARLPELTKETRDKLEREHWKKKLEHEANIQNSSEVQGISASVLELSEALEKEMIVHADGPVLTNLKGLLD